MLPLILAFGAAAGVLVAVPMCIMVANSEPGSAGQSQLVGYLTMMVALSLIFVGVKRYRDRVLGGVIRFGTALGLGLGISAVAGVIYVIGWEITLAVTDFAFVDASSHTVVPAGRSSSRTPMASAEKHSPSSSSVASI